MKRGVINMKENVMNRVSFHPLYAILALLLLSSCMGSAFKNAQDTDTVAGYDQFLKDHYQSEHKERAIELKDKALFREVKQKIEQTSSKDVYYRARIFDEYLAEFPNGRYSTKIKEDREKDWYKQVVLRNTAEGFQSYLDEYPKGVFFQQINRKYENSLYRTAQKRKTIASCDRYLNTFPDGKFTEEINKLREVVWFESAKTSHTILSYETYLKEYPIGKFSKDASQKIEALIFQHVKESLTFKVYFKKYPRGKFSKELKQLKEKRQFKKSLKIDTIAGYKAFLLEYPRGRYTMEARHKMEQILFLNARKENTIAAYQNYLVQYPKGRYKKQTNKLIERLGKKNAFTDKASFKNSDLNAWVFTKEVNILFQYDWFIKNFPNSQFRQEAEILRSEKAQALQKLK